MWTPMSAQPQEVVTRTSSESAHIAFQLQAKLLASSPFEDYPSQRVSKPAALKLLRALCAYYRPTSDGLLISDCSEAQLTLITGP